jgi:hypothetical protein
MKAIKTLLMAILGRPNVMVAIAGGNLVFFFVFIYSVWVIGAAIKNLTYVLMNEKRETWNGERSLNV